jgi:hypothetical protein
MGGGFYIALEHDISGIDPLSIDGKGLSRASDALDKAARPLGVKPLMEFFSAGPEELADVLGEGADLPDVPEKRFFDAADGLNTVRALIGHVEKNSGTMKRPEWVLGDLREFERILAAAKEAGVRWHLAIDY